MVSDNITIDNVTKLLNLYQKAIEHYSALNAPQFTDFLNRQKSLLGRDDIQIVLNSIEEKENQNKEQQ